MTMKEFYLKLSYVSRLAFLSAKLQSGSSFPIPLLPPKKLFSLLPPTPESGRKALAHSSLSSPGIALNSRSDYPGPGCAGCSVPGEAARGRPGGRVRAPRRRRQRLRAEGGGPALGAPAPGRDRRPRLGDPRFTFAARVPQWSRPLAGSAVWRARQARPLSRVRCRRGARPAPAPSRPHLLAPRRTEKMSAESILHLTAI